ncbi:hypothetical protein ATCC90586_003286 [Pythium insidiosum]|nr:hypothetical protein ATCC90586_003286 [Pythium insidiosum]
MATPASALSSSLEELKKEPWRLQLQADTTAEQLRALVLKNYHVFIQSNQCAALVKDDLTALKEQTREIMTGIPELKTFCAQMQRDMEGIVAKHGDIQFVFDHFLQLTELLEIPQLLEACIHNELFDAALDVVQFAHETFVDDAKNDAPNFVIVALNREVAQMTALLREKLLQKLREDLQLALCVRVVGYLRRLDALTDTTRSVGTAAYERQLKEEFLSARGAWLASLTRSLSIADPYQFTVQLIDVKRTSWFDMITQYSAIFGSENVDGKVDPPLCQWATTTVAEFIQILMRQLPKIDDFSSLATILEQSLFFGGSLGRVGINFRAILVVFFEDHVFNLMAQSWDAACRDFADSLGAHAIASSSSSSGSISTSSRTPIVLGSYRHSMSNGNSTPAATLRPRLSSSSLLPEEDTSPPRMLMSFPILAEFTNAILSSLNDLRLCTLTSLEARLAQRLQASLEAVVLTVQTFCEDNKLQVLATAEPTTPRNSSSESSKSTQLSESMRFMCEALATELLPYLVRCFNRLYPPARVSRSSLLASASRPSTGAAAAAVAVAVAVAADVIVRPQRRPPSAMSSLLLRLDARELDAIIDKLLSVRNAQPGEQVTLSESEIRGLCLHAREVFLKQPMLLEIEAPIKICGDLHGQYFDLLRLFEFGGFPPESNYLFLGDYVDRGCQSLETICLLFAYKIKYPNNVFILRGNHEDPNINKTYGFFDECKRRLSVKIWKTFTDCFECLPVAALVDTKILCMHGGLSPELSHLDQIRRLPRPTEVPDSGLLSDLLWADPDKTTLGWGVNSRGISYTFGSDIVRQFLRRHDLDLICRAHQVVEDGYEFFANRQLVTVFSAPNYCGEYDNAGAMMSVDENLMCSFQILRPAEKKTSRIM